MGDDVITTLAVIAGGLACVGIGAILAGVAVTHVASKVVREVLAELGIERAARPTR